MDQSAAIAVVSGLGADQCGVFRGEAAAAQGVTRRQIGALRATGVIERELPDTYRLTAVARSAEQQLRAALLWAGEASAAAGSSAGAWYGLEGVSASVPEIVIPRGAHPRSTAVHVMRVTNPTALMIRAHRGLRVTGPEATLARLAHCLDDEALEIACEDARRRRLTTVSALRAYLGRYARRGHRGVARLRALLAELDPYHPSRSTLEVKVRRLLVAHGITDFVRELPLEWNGRTYHYDFAFEQPRVILEANGRRWHDDPVDYEHDHEKWSVPARHGYRLLFATWTKVTKTPADLGAELCAAVARPRDRW